MSKFLVQKGRHSHLTECEGILEAYTRVQRGTGLPAVPGGMRTLMLQEDMDGGTRSALIAFYAAAWKTRHTCRRLEKTTTPDERADIIKTCLECPWLTYCTPTTTQKERRRGNLRPPKEVSTKCAVYRSDGASRRNGRGVAWLKWVRPFGLQENGEKGRQQSERENISARG